MRRENKRGLLGNKRRCVDSKNENLKLPFFLSFFMCKKRFGNYSMYTQMALAYLRYDCCL